MNTFKIVPFPAMISLHLILGMKQNINLFFYLNLKYFQRKMLPEL